jgi:hypothetical protein
MSDRRSWLLALVARFVGPEDCGVHRLSVRRPPTTCNCLPATRGRASLFATAENG